MKAAWFNGGGVQKLNWIKCSYYGAEANLGSDFGPDFQGCKAPPSAFDLFMLFGLCRNTAAL